MSAAAVVVKAVQHWDEFTGRIRAVETVELRPRVSGAIERVNYTEGSEVRAGEVLFVIDQRPYQAALEQARAELARALARTELAAKALTRAEKLAGSRSISTAELDEHRATLAEARASVRAGEAAVAVAELDLAFTEVRAPIDGRAGRAQVTAGNLVSAQPNATLLTTIVSQDPVHVHFEPDEQSYRRYLAPTLNGAQPLGRAIRHPVRVALAGDDGYAHAGEVDFIDNQLDSGTGTIQVRAVLPNAGRQLTPGFFARIRLLASGTFEATLVDDKAVLTDQDRQYVYIVDENGRAQRRDVELGRLFEGLRVVRGGLERGDRVIVHGVQKVFFPGMPVDAQVIDMGDPPPAPTAATSQ